MIWSENLCRLCGNISPSCHSIFKLVGSDTIENKIKKCFNFAMFREDCKPKEVCDQCLIKLEQCSEFVDICTSTNQRLEALLISRNSWPDIEELSGPEYMQPKSVIVNLKGNIENLQKDSEDILPLGTINLTVPLNEDVLQLVGNSDVYSENLPENLDNFADAQSRYVEFYPDCNNTVLRHSSNIENLSLEGNLYPEQDFSYGYSQKVSENIELAERNCTDYFNTQPTELTFGSFTNEVSTENSSSNTNLCVDGAVLNENVSKCKPKETLISVDAVRKKLNLQNNCLPVNKKEKKQFKCPHCERIFVRRISLNSHIALHTKAKPFTCTTCGRTFPVKSELTIHKKIHSDQYQCTICLKTFIVPSKLERHIRTHTKERPFKCNFENCGKTFADQSNLSEHENIHLDTKNFKCTKCERCFKTKSQLKSHKLTHISGVSYTCDICKKSYKYKTNLIFHIKAHNGFKCPYCNLSCEKLKYLVKHRKECNKK